MTVRRSGFGRRETSIPPNLALWRRRRGLVVVRSLSLRGTSTQRKLRSESGTREVRVHVIVWVADVG
jgi:hypothetical protein